MVTERVADKQCQCFHIPLDRSHFANNISISSQELEQMAALHADVVMQCGLLPCGVSALYVNVNAYCWRTEAQQLFVLPFILFLNSIVRLQIP